MSETKPKQTSKDTYVPKRSLFNTKGKGFAKQEDVESKREVAEEWIAKANESTEVDWAYLFVLDERFDQYKGLGPFDAFVKAVG